MERREGGGVRKREWEKNRSAKEVASKFGLPSIDRSGEPILMGRPRKRRCQALVGRPANQPDCLSILFLFSIHPCKSRPSFFCAGAKRQKRLSLSLSLSLGRGLAQIQLRRRPMDTSDTNSSCFVQSYHGTKYLLSPYAILIYCEDFSGEDDDDDKKRLVGPRVAAPQAKMSSSKDRSAYKVLPPSEILSLSHLSDVKALAHNSHAHVAHSPGNMHSSCSKYTFLLGSALERCAT